MSIKTVPWGFRRKVLEGGRVVYPVVRADVYTIQQDAKCSLNPQVRFPSQFDAVRPHLAYASRWYFCIDLHRAFDQVRFERFSDVYELPDEVRHNPDCFFHVGGGLIQGAPASPHLFQYYCATRLDPAMRVFCQRSGIVFTRYVDDLLFSARTPIERGARKGIRAIVTSAGFRVQERKVQVVDTKHSALEYLGMSLYRGRVTPTAEFMRDMEQTEEGRRRAGKVAWSTKVLALNSTPCYSRERRAQRD
jgi:hypothetical protein